MKILRTTLIISMLIACTHTLYAQNLVPNPGFENFTTCPTHSALLYYAAPWVNGNSNNCDFHHACHGGISYAYCGDGYGRLITYYPFMLNTPRPNSREYLQVQLSSPLVAGQVYDVSLWYVSVSGTYQDKLGIYLSGPTQPYEPSGKYYGYNNPAGSGHNAPASVTPQIESPAGVPLFNSSFSWAPLSGTYTAVGGEEWITIGSFHKDVDHTIAGDTAGTTVYIIDNVCVAPAGQGCFIPQFSYSDTTFCPADPDPTVTMGGPGIFSYLATPSSATLSIDTTTGEIDISSSNIGSYIITYSLIDSLALCPAESSITIKIDNVKTAIDKVVACDSYTWIDGNTYTYSTNTVTDTLTSAAGCDSVVTLDLTIKYSSTSTDIKHPCATSYTWPLNGITYTASTNTPTATLTNAAGCDSVVTLDLRMNKLTASINNTNSCIGQTANLNATVTSVALPAAYTTCGINATNYCGNGTTSGQVGNGHTNSSNGPIIGGSSSNSRVEYIITAAELISAGVESGAISSVAWNVTIKNHLFFCHGG